MAHFPKATAEDFARTLGFAGSLDSLFRRDPAAQASSATTAPSGIDAGTRASGEDLAEVSRCRDA